MIRSTRKLEPQRAKRNCSLQLHNYELERHQFRKRNKGSFGTTIKPMKFSVMISMEKCNFLHSFISYQEIKERGGYGGIFFCTVRQELESYLAKAIATETDSTFFRFGFKVDR